VTAVGGMIIFFVGALVCIFGSLFLGGELKITGHHCSNNKDYESALKKLNKEFPGAT